MQRGCLLNTHVLVSSRGEVFKYIFQNRNRTEPSLLQSPRLLNTFWVVFASGCHIGELLELWPGRTVVFTWSGWEWAG